MKDISLIKKNKKVFSKSRLFFKELPRFAGDTGKHGSSLGDDIISRYTARNFSGWSLLSLAFLLEEGSVDQTPVLSQLLWNPKLMLELHLNQIGSRLNGAPAAAEFFKKEKPEIKAGSVSNSQLFERQFSNQRLISNVLKTAPQKSAYLNSKLLLPGGKSNQQFPAVSVPNSPVSEKLFLNQQIISGILKTLVREPLYPESKLFLPGGKSTPPFPVASVPNSRVSERWFSGSILKTLVRESLYLNNKLILPGSKSRSLLPAASVSNSPVPERWFSSSILETLARESLYLNNKLLLPGSKSRPPFPAASVLNTPVSEKLFSGGILKTLVRESLYLNNKLFLPGGKSRPVLPAASVLNTPVPERWFSSSILKTLIREPLYSESKLFLPGGKSRPVLPPQTVQSSRFNPLYSMSGQAARSPADRVRPLPYGAGTVSVLLRPLIKAFGDYLSRFQVAFPSDRNAVDKIGSVSNVITKENRVSVLTEKKRPDSGDNYLDRGENKFGQTVSENGLPSVLRESLFSVQKNVFPFKNSFWGRQSFPELTRQNPVFSRSDSVSDNGRHADGGLYFWGFNKTNSRASKPVYIGPALVAAEHSAMPFLKRIYQRAAALYCFSGNPGTGLTKAVKFGLLSEPLKRFTNGANQASADSGFIRTVNQAGFFAPKQTVSERTLALLPDRAGFSEREENQRVSNRAHKPVGNIMAGALRNFGLLSRGPLKTVFSGYAQQRAARGGNIHFTSRAGMLNPLIEKSPSPPLFAGGKKAGYIPAEQFAAILTNRVRTLFEKSNCLPGGDSKKFKSGRLEYTNSIPSSIKPVSLTPASLISASPEASLKPGSLTPASLILASSVEASSVQASSIQASSIQASSEPDFAERSAGNIDRTNAFSRPADIRLTTGGNREAFIPNEPSGIRPKSGMISANGFPAGYADKIHGNKTHGEIFHEDVFHLNPINNGPDHTIVPAAYPKSGGGDVGRDAELAYGQSRKLEREASSAGSRFSAGILSGLKHRAVKPFHRARPGKISSADSAKIVRGNIALNSNTRFHVKPDIEKSALAPLNFLRPEKTAALSREATAVLKSGYTLAQAFPPAELAVLAQPDTQHTFSAPIKSSPPIYYKTDEEKKRQSDPGPAKPAGVPINAGVVYEKADVSFVNSLKNEDIAKLAEKVYARLEIMLRKDRRRFGL